MKKFIIITGILIFATLFIWHFSGYIHKPIFSVPDKIIVYKNGVPKEINKDSKNYNKIVKLMNERINTNKISTAKDIIDVFYVERLKEGELSIEFVYNKEHEMNVKGDGFMPFKYYRLFFTLVNKDCEYMRETFQHGDEQGYIDCSRGPIDSPSKALINLVKGL